ncbi:MAG: Ig-like domain-containing protein [Acidimicrobiales bacterium]
MPKRRTRCCAPGVTLDASVNNEAGISRVQFQLTGGSLSEVVIATATLTYYGWIAQWNSTTVADGSYTIQSVATDPSGLMGRSPGIPIAVSN